MKLIRINNRKKRARKLFFAPFLALSFFLINVWASFGLPNSDFDKANEFYKGKEYQHAILLYKKLIEQGIESPEIYFNLGNCYFKCDSNAQAILNFEKAKKLSPGDEDILFNLKVANQRITDKIDPAPELLISSWWTEFKHSKTMDGWAWLCISCWVLSFLLLATFIGFKASTTKRLGFWGGLFFLILAVSSFFLAEDQSNTSRKKNDAIVMIGSINLKSSPEEKGKDIFIIHSGSKLRVINTEGTWSEVQLPDKNVGWLPSSSIAFI